MTQAEVKSSPGGAMISRLSSGYMRQPSWICLRLLMHWMPCARIFAWLKAGNNKAARMAMMAITTRSSIRVKASRLFRIPSNEPEKFGDRITDDVGNRPVVDHAAGRKRIEGIPHDW